MLINCYALDKTMQYFINVVKFIHIILFIIKIKLPLLMLSFVEISNKLIKYNSFLYFYFLQLSGNKSSHTLTIYKPVLDVL